VTSSVLQHRGNTVCEGRRHIAVSLLARRYFSNSQAPLSSRTVETLSTNHFRHPSIRRSYSRSSIRWWRRNGAGAARLTTGIVGTPQGRSGRSTRPTAAPRLHRSDDTGDPRSLLASSSIHRAT